MSNPMKWRKVSDFFVSAPGAAMDVRVMQDPLAKPEEMHRQWRVKVNGAWLGDVNVPFPSAKAAQGAAEAYVRSRLEDAVRELGGVIIWREEPEWRDKS